MTNQEIAIRYIKLKSEATPTIKSTAGEAGFDLTAISKTIDAKSDCIIYGTGLAVEIPQGYVGLLFPRSSVYKKSLSLANNIGVIDSDYRGEIKAIFRKINNMTDQYIIGDRICQIVFLQLPKIVLQEVDKHIGLTPTERGEGGFGSSDTTPLQPVAKASVTSIKI